jgi:hypothetical protein
MVLEATMLPDDMLTEEVISELVDELGLPRLSPAGEAIAYAIEVVGQGAVLDTGKPLSDAGISNGDRLRLTTGGPAAEPNGEAESATPVVVLADETVEVVLSVLDLNKSERTTVSADRPVGELLQQIAANFNLPARDKLNELIVYRLESKALGRYLANRETLRRAGVPRLDRLTVHREEIAGAVARGPWPVARDKRRDTQQSTNDQSYPPGHGSRATGHER